MTLSHFSFSKGLVFILYLQLWLEIAGFIAPSYFCFRRTGSLLKAMQGSTSHSSQTPFLLQETINLTVDLWRAVAYPCENVTGVQFTLKDYNLKRNHIKGLLRHFQFCKDCALDNSFLMATQNERGEDSLYLSYITFPLLTDDENDDSQWGHFDPSLINDKEEETPEVENSSPIFPREDDNQIVLHDTKQWVEQGEISFFVLVLFANKFL